MKPSNNTEIYEMAPWKFYLSQNYPNPFREKTVIKYCVAHKTRVKLTVYNSECKAIKKLVDEVQNPGTYEVEFSLINLHSRPQGHKKETYFYRLEAGDYKSEKKMEILK